jgi:hypothetical protein
LFTDLGQDKNGNIQFKPHLLSDVTDVIVPGFFENLRYVPVRFPNRIIADVRFLALKSATR